VSRRAGALLSILLAAAAPATGWAQTVKAPAVAPGGGVAGGLSATKESASRRLAAALNQIGMGPCAPTLMRAADFVFEDGDAEFTVQPMGPDANRWPTVVMIEGAHKANGRTRLTTLTVAPGAAGCPGFYEQVIHWPQPCAELKRTVFAAFAQPRPILRDVQLSELNPGLQLYLTPAGPAGCVSVKKEMFR
jgi:hypothetical protein